MLGALRPRHPLALLAALALVPCAAAGAEAPGYRDCAPSPGTPIVQVAIAPCAEAERLAEADPAGLEAAGWTPLRAAALEDEDGHDVVAVKPDGAAMRLRRPSPAPDLDGWAAGRELLFARGELVGGMPVPAGAQSCTAAWLVRLPAGRLGGLSAAHCGGLSRLRSVARRYAALRRPPQAGIVLGSVRRFLARRMPLDALLLPVPVGPRRPALPVVDVGVDRPPHRIAAAAAPTAGRAACFTGSTSGPDRCGSLLGPSAAPFERRLSEEARLALRCTTIAAAPGDSGGPVYTPPRADGSVRALGIVTLVVGEAQRMCFTPLAPVLDRLRGELATWPTPPRRP